MNIKCLAVAGALLLAAPVHGIAAVPVIEDTTIVNKGTGVPAGQAYSNIFTVLAGTFRLDVFASGEKTDSAGEVTATLLGAADAVIGFVTVQVNGVAESTAFKDFTIAAGQYRLWWTGTSEGKGILDARATLVAQTVAVPGPEAGAGLGALALAGLAYAITRRKKMQTPA